MNSVGYFKHYLVSFTVLVIRESGVAWTRREHAHALKELGLQGKGRND